MWIFFLFYSLGEDLDAQRKEVAVDEPLRVQYGHDGKDLLPIIAQNFIRLSNLSNSLRHLYGRTHL